MRISRANAKAIKYACLKFHYAKRVPQVCYGYNVYNDEEEWCGVVCFGTGANFQIGSEFGLVSGEILELVRVALNGKQGHNKTSQVLSLCLNQLKKDNPLLKMLVSYADSDQNHKGIIYQATNWIYLGKRMEDELDGSVICDGKRIHSKTLSDFIKRWGGVGDLSRIDFLKKYYREVIPYRTKGKEKYVYFF